MQSVQRPIAVLFVCMGNICRSPAAEGAFRHLVQKRALADFFYIDSAGTTGYHKGEQPNSYTRRVAEKYGIRLDHRARKFVSEDFEVFDWILVMDRQNYRDVLELSRNRKEQNKVLLLRRFDPRVAKNVPAPDVPDPYYGGLRGFEDVQEMVSRSCEKLLDWLWKMEKNTDLLE